MYVKVRNINGTSDNLPTRGYTSWLDYWIKKIKPNTNYVHCSNKTCDRLAEVGGHVKRVNVKDDSWFITPLCKSCNGKVSSETYFVSKDKLCPIKL